MRTNGTVHSRVFLDDDDDDSGGRSAEEQAAYERRMMAPRRSGLILPIGMGSATNAFTAGKRSVSPGASYPRFDFVVRDLGICVGPPAVLIAMGYSGKSFLAQDLAICAASAGLFLGKHAVKPGRVLHLDYDQGTEQTEVRYLRLLRGRDLGGAALRHDIDFARPVKKLDDSDAEDALKEAAKDYSLCIIDALRPAIGADENDSRVREPLNMLGRVSEATRCAFLLIHHTGKHDGGDDRMVGRGSSAIFDAAGTVLTLRRKPAADDDFIYHLSQTKSRTGRLSSPLLYRLEDVGDYVEAINGTAGIRLSVADAEEAATSNDDERVLRVLRESAGAVSRTDLEERVRMKGKRFDETIRRLTEPPGNRVERELRDRKAYFKTTESYRAGWEGSVGVANA